MVQDDKVKANLRRVCFFIYVYTNKRFDPPRNTPQTGSKHTGYYLA